MSRIEIELMNHEKLVAEIDINRVVSDLGKIETLTKGTKKRFLKYLNAGMHDRCVEIAWAKQDKIDNIIDFVEHYKV